MFLEPHRIQGDDAALTLLCEIPNKSDESSEPKVCVLLPSTFTHDTQGLATTPSPCAGQS
jgi:hypothetical protein